MKGTVIQLSTAMFLALLGAMASFANVWPSYAIGLLKSPQSPIGYQLSESEAHIISSIQMLGSLMSTLITGYVAEAFGRKRTQILCGLIYLVSWCLIVTARSAMQIIIARFITGFSSGMSIVSILVYISEITEVTNRGSCGTVSPLLYNVGILASYLQGWFFSYDVICYINITSIAVFVILMSCFKESPVWLLRSGREKEALSALKFYRGVSETTDAILEELAYLKSQYNFKNIDSAAAEKPMLRKEKIEDEKEYSDEENTENKNPWVLLVTVDYNRRALITSIMFMILTVSLGMIAVQTYANQFFANAAPTMSPDLCSVLLALVQIATSSITMMVTDLVSRRIMMITTCVIATVCLAILGALMRWPWAPVWVAPLAIIIYCITYHLGCINIVFIQLSECFGRQVNSAATSIILCFMFLSNFLLIYSFGPAVNYLGIDVTFFIFAAIGLVTTVASILFLKETRRVPLEDVQKMYASGFLYRKQL